MIIPADWVFMHRKTWLEMLRMTEARKMLLQYAFRLDIPCFSM